MDRWRLRAGVLVAGLARSVAGCLVAVVLSGATTLSSSTGDGGEMSEEGAAPMPRSAKVGCAVTAGADLDFFGGLGESSLISMI